MSDIGKIAYLTGTWPQWSETFISQEVKHLCAAGVPLLPIAVFPGAESSTPDLPQFSFLSSAQPTSASLNTADKKRSLLPKPVHRTAALLKHRALIKKLVAVVREHNVRHIYAAFAGLPGLLVAATSQASGIPYSISMHANDVLCSNYDDAFLFAQASEIHCCNQRVIKMFEERCPEYADKVRYLPHGIDLSRWALREAGGFHSPLRFLFVGRMVPKKDPATAKCLVKSLNTAGIPAELTLVGDGPLGHEVGAMGVMTSDEVYQRMLDSDFLLCTSRDLESGDMEGLPNVILEAMACGLPVMSTLSGSIGEVLSSETGYEINAADTAGFANVIRKIMEEPEECQTRVAEARRIVSERYNAETCVAEKAKRLETLLNQ